MKDELIAALEAGWEVKFLLEWKRMEPPGKCRDFYVRHVWKARMVGTVIECQWEGFETAKECIEDFLSKKVWLT